MIKYKKEAGPDHGSASFFSIVVNRYQLWLRCLFGLLAMLPPFENHGENRNQNDDDNYQFKVLLYEWDVSKEISQQREDKNPGNTANDIIGGKI